QVPLELSHALLHDPDVLADLRHQDGALERGHQELRHDLDTAIVPHISSSLSIPEGERQSLTPHREDSGETSTKTFVDVGHLRSEIAERTAADAGTLPLRLDHTVEEAADLGNRMAVRIRKAGIECPLHEGGDDVVEDGVAQVFLALEVVIEGPLADATSTEEVVERGRVVALDEYQALRRGQDRIPRLAPFPYPALPISSRCH